MNALMKFYNALGNNKGQRFRRFMLILMLIAGVIGYGFYSGALKVSFTKQVQAGNE